MEPIEKPELDGRWPPLPIDVKKALRRGDLSVYDILEMLGANLRYGAEKLDRTVKELDEKFEAEKAAVEEEVEERTSESEEELRELVLKLIAQGLIDLKDAYGSTEHLRGYWSAKEAVLVPYEAKDAAGLVDTVYNLGCKWMCLATGTTDEPTWVSEDWMYLSGEAGFTIVFDSSNGTAFRAGHVETWIDSKILFGTFDVTEKIMTGKESVGVNWSRDTGVPWEDEQWFPTVKEGTHGLCIRVNSYDVGDNFHKNGYAIFTLTIKIPTSSGYATVQNQVNFKL